MEKSQYFNFHPLPLIRSYFEDLEIFSLSVEHSPHSSIILSHLAKAVALGGSVKNFISDHKCICLVSVVLGFSSSLCESVCEWLHYKGYSNFRLSGSAVWPVWCASDVTYTSSFEREADLWPARKLP